MSEETKKKAAPVKEAKPAAEKPAKAADETKPRKAAAPAAEAPKAEAAAAPAGPVAAAAPTAAELLGEDAAAKKVIKAKHAKNISVGIERNICDIGSSLPGTRASITRAPTTGWPLESTACPLKRTPGFSTTLIPVLGCPSATLNNADSPAPDSALRAFTT